MKTNLVSPALAILIAGCGGSASGPLGSFNVDLTEDATLSISHPSGLALRSVPGSFASFRRADATYELSVGSFRISEEPRSDWRSAKRATDGDRDDARASWVLADEAGGELASLTFSLSGESLIIRATASDPSLDRAAISFACDPPSAGGFLGFGAQTFDVDHRGQVVPIWVSEQGIGKVSTDEPHEVWNVVGTRHQSYLAVPTMLAPREGASWGLHATTYYRSIWDLCASDPGVLRIEMWEGTAEVVLSPGPSPLDVIEQQTAITGRVPLGPDWTFGVWMERVGGRQAVLDELGLLRSEHIPVSAIWSEDWRGGHARGDDYVLEEDWRWDQALYPDISTMIDELHRQGVRFMAYENTFVVEDADVWEEARAGGRLVVDHSGDPFMFTAPTLEPSALADLFSEGARAFVRSELRAALALGVDGWMADFAEWYPADPRTVAPSDGSDPQAAHHRYPVAWAEVNREAIDASGRDDVVVFHRSGYTGSQSKARVIWAGDQRTSFQDDDGLPTVIPIISGLGVAGFPIVTHDIPGYASATNPPAGKELFFRWTVLGALDPVMRTHHGRSAFANWRWSSDAETIEMFRRWASFHTRLFPTWKGLAREASEHGAPILRPLALYDPSDVAVHGIKDEFMIGDALLVAPVVTASTAARSVRLPRGRWFELASGEVHEGGVELEVSVPLGECAIFARAGAIVPLLPEGVESINATDAVVDLDEVRNAREIEVWLGAPGRARDGEGGTYALSSEHPIERGTMVTIEGGTVLDSAPGRVRVAAAPNTSVSIVDASGAAHTISTSGFDPSATLVFDVVW